MNLPKDVDVMPELTPCGDVGMVSAYLQALANEGVKTALVVSHLPLVGYLVSELCPGKRPRCLLPQRLPASPSTPTARANSTGR